MVGRGDVSKSSALNLLRGERLALALAANEAVDVNARDRRGKTPLHYACV